MKYKLINNNKNFGSYAEKILYNRGIKNPKKYLSLDDTSILEYSLLSNIYEAVKLLILHAENQNNITVLVDEDCDGITSAAMLYNYIKLVFPYANLNYLLHNRSKAHGLSKDVKVPLETDLLFIVDAGTNDVEECKVLNDKEGISIIIIDHHIQEKPNPYAIIVNNQTCEYPNKSLSGAGMVWQYMRAIDDELWENHADDYADLAALGIIGDSMDIREEENRRIIELGLKNVRNRAFQALLNKQSYSTGGEVNPITVAFYIVPLINALIRSGTQEEKDLLFRAFIEAYETFPYTKRGGEEIQETIYDRVARLATNCKAKQGREVDKAMELLRNKIEKYKWDENRILFCDGTEIDGSFTGLVAIKLANEYNKPCVLVRENSWKPGYFGGSIRNFDCSPIESLKDFLLSTGQFEFIQGHNNAAGISIEKSKIRDAIALANEMLKDVEFDKTYTVDFILSPDELTYDFIRQVNELRDYYGQGISECFVAVERIKINTKDIEVIGANKDTWRLSLDDCIVIKFKVGENDEIIRKINAEWGGEDIKLNIVARISMNQYNGIITPQAIVVDYDIID